MAYGINWFSEFDDLEGNIYRVEILRNGFSGVPIEVLSGEKPFVVALMDDASSDPYYSMRTQKAEIQWISDEVSNFAISDIFVIDEHEYKVRFYEVDPETEALSSLWQGYLVPTDCNEPFSSKPYPVDLSASCGLALLHDQYFLDNNGRFLEGTMSLFNIIRGCLDQTKLELGIDIQLGLIEKNEFYTVMLSQTYIDVDGLRGMKAFDVLDGILNSVGAFISQERGKWVIKGVRELTAHEIRSYRFNFDGSGYEFSDVSQIASIGRTELDLLTSNVIPKKEVEESLAEPVSFITNNISPGIPVNRLKNGTFSPLKTAWGESFMSSMDSWAPDPKSWGIKGDGKPADPYRYEMYGSVKSTGDIVYRSKSPQYNVGIYNPEVITIRRDGDKDYYPNLKIVVSGAFRIRDGARLMICCRLNDGDRDYVEWLDEGGTWNHKKRNKELERSNIKVTGDVPHNPDTFKLLADMPLQTFEIKSSKITEYLNRPGGWIAKLYFTIYPATIGSDSFPEISNQFSPALWLEDFSVTINTETLYEAEHAYQIDAKKIIRNGDSYEYSTIVADKLNILTPEQKHDDNRVMTGYASVGAFVLSSGWKRKVGGSFTGPAEPLQHITLRERLRLLCGKRRVIEGSFYGKGIFPSNSVINQYDEDSDSYYTITGWSWDVKERTYDLRLQELDFSQLPDEVITLSSERGDGGRGNRLYQGASGSVSNGSGNNGSGQQEEEIALDDIPPFEYEILVEDEEFRICDLGELIRSHHTPNFLQAQLLTWPDWISEITIYRGEDLSLDDIPDGGILQIWWKGKPTKSGEFRILVELVGVNGEDLTASIPIVVEPSEDFIEEWPPVFSAFPVLYFIVGKELTREINLKDFLDPDGLHDGTGLIPKLLTKPYWVSSAPIVFMKLSVTGKPDKPDVNYVTYQIFDAIGRSITIPFEVRAIPALDVRYAIIDVEEVSILGYAPGTFSVPDTFDVKINVDGPHDQVYMRIKGGGADGSSVSLEDTQVVNYTELASYRIFQATDGTAGVEGLYEVEFAAYLNEIEVYRETVYFTLGDEEYLNKVTAEFWNAHVVKLNDIGLQGDYRFKNPGAFDVKTITAGLLHDAVSLKFLLAGEVIKETNFGPLTPLEDAEYFVYPTAQTGQLPGAYALEAVFELASAKIMQRRWEFEVLDKIPVAEGGLTLVEMIPKTANYNVIQQVPLKGLAIDLPENGYNVLCTGFGAEFDYVSWKVFNKVSNQFVELDIERYTKRPSFFVPSALVSVADILAFWDYSSLDIGDLHQAPSTVRFAFTARVGGETGEIVGIQQADITFREPLAPEDYSGLLFLHVGPGVEDLIDPDMPISGSTYTIPEFPVLWTVAARHTKENLEFDAVKVQLYRAGVLVHNSGDYVTYPDFFPAVTDVGNNQEAYIYGFVTGVERILLNPSNANVSIDQPDTYKVVATFERFGIAIETQETTFTLILDEDIPEVPEADCCGGCESLKFDFVNSTTWNVFHNLDKHPDLTITIGGIKVNSKVTYIDNNNLKVDHLKPKTGSVEIN